MLKARSCKIDWCRHAYPTKPGNGRKPSIGINLYISLTSSFSSSMEIKHPCALGQPCPGYLNPEHPDDLGDSSLQIAKNKGYLRIIELIKYV